MNTKRIWVLALALILVAGCSGGKFAEEKTLLTTVTKAMDSFNCGHRIRRRARGRDQGSGFVYRRPRNRPAQDEGNDSAHPEWENNPPEELKGTFEKFDAATNAFRAETMPKVMQVRQGQHGQCRPADRLEEIQ